MKKYIILFISLFFPLSSFGQQSFAELTEKIINSVVNISTVLKEDKNFSQKDSIALGSGFIIDKNGYIITNNHVISDAELINVTTNNNKNYEAKLIGKDEKTDIALIKIDSDEEFFPVEFGDSDNIRVGDWIIAIGNPFGLGASVTAGIISAKSRDIDSGSYNDYIQTDASINQGNSGGPMFNMEGKLIGMNTSIFSTDGNSIGIGFATPSNIIVWVAEQLKTYGKVNRGWIGIKMQPDEMETINDENYLIKKGVLILGITENSPAYKAGLVAGDIIIKINNEEISSPKNFSKIIYTTKPGEKIKLLIWNNKKISEKIINVELQETEDKKIKNKDFLTLQNYIPEIGYISDNLTIIDIEKNSPAEIQNIQKGDVIIKADNYNLKNFNDLQKYIENIYKDKVVLSLLRENDIKNVVINFKEKKQ